NLNHDLLQLSKLNQTIVGDCCLYVCFSDLDPVQRLFLEKIREYKNLRRLNGGLLEEEPDYKKHLSEETAKLQRLYGGGDLTSFPQFTFTGEREMEEFAF
uniref:ATP synthase peripheral stalk subunit F6, mitochondrial n=1 Tax=Stegastes partitus TaxID=144197 RepID=A0A3B5B7B7_9TELE